MRRPRRVRLAGFGLLVVLSGWTLAMPKTAPAHEVRPAHLQIEELGPGRFGVIWRTPILSGRRLPVLLGFPDGVDVVVGPNERRMSDSVVERSVIEVADGLVGKRMTFVGLQATITDVLVRVRWLDGTVDTTLVRPSRSWVEFRPRQTSFDVARSFFVEGLEHIGFGFDHLLFVAALMLLVRDGRALVRTITAFTIAHSITLTLATLGWVALPPGPVEILIAFSIALIAAEIVARERGRVTLTIESPWIVAFAFGLLHGFGFAGALRDIGLPPQEIPLALFWFNVGVEVGQLLFVAVVAVALSVLRRILDRPRIPVWAPGYAIGSIAAFWTLERLYSAFS